jgi:hypothetical protein
MDGVPKIKDRIVAGAGSIQKAIEALRGDDSDDALAFIERYDSISESDLPRLAIEEIFTAAGLTARRFVEVLTGALMQQSSDVTKMLVSVAQPRVVEATIKAATESLPIIGNEGEVVGWTNGDIKAQELFHKATGFLPTPKGAQTTINLQQLNQTAVSSDEEKCDAPQSMDDFLMEIQDVVRPKALNPPVETVPINAPLIEYMEVEV